MYTRPESRQVHTKQIHSISIPAVATLHLYCSLATPTDGCNRMFEGNEIRGQTRGTKNTYPANKLGTCLSDTWKFKHDLRYGQTAKSFKTKETKKSIECSDAFSIGSECQLIASSCDDILRMEWTVHDPTCKLLRPPENSTG